jgi:adenosylcobyric acid synthase
MLGVRIADPAGVESGGSEPGLRLIDVTTCLDRTKITTRVEALPLHLGPDFSSPAVLGYHIHMGRTTHGTDRPCFRTVRAGPRKLVVEEEREEAELLDGAVSPDGLVWGTYIHGVFDAPLFRRAWLNRARARKGLPALDASVSLETTRELKRALDRWADHLDAHLDLRPVWAYLNQGAVGCA